LLHSSLSGPLTLPLQELLARLKDAREWSDPSHYVAVPLLAQARAVAHGATLCVLNQLLLCVREITSLRDSLAHYAQINLGLAEELRAAQGCMKVADDKAILADVEDTLLRRLNNLLNDQDPYHSSCDRDNLAPLASCVSSSSSFQTPPASPVASLLSASSSPFLVREPRERDGLGDFSCQEDPTEETRRKRKAGESCHTESGQLFLTVCCAKRGRASCHREVNDEDHADLPTVVHHDGWVQTDLGPQDSSALQVWTPAASLVASPEETLASGITQLSSANIQTPFSQPEDPLLPLHTKPKHRAQRDNQVQEAETQNDSDVRVEKLQPEMGFRHAVLVLNPQESKGTENQDAIQRLEGGDVRKSIERTIMYEQSQMPSFTSQSSMFPSPELGSDDLDDI